MNRRSRVTVAYDGSAFHGFAEDRLRTVMGVLRASIETIVQQPIHPVGAGRTDAGVHAWGQVVSCDLPNDTDLVSLQRRVNRMCGPDVAVRDWRWTDDPDFSARFSATSRHYRYHVLNSPEPNPFLANTAWHITTPINLWALRLACDPIIGEHDFSSFCRRPAVEGEKPPKSMRRMVFSASWNQVSGDTAGLLRFEIRANAFCHQMVRALVGSMIDVGLGKITTADFHQLLLRRDRTGASPVAPPRGLCLWEVGYPVHIR